VVRRPLWEQQVMASCEEPSPGHWEALEAVLLERINRTNDLQQENWEQCESQEEPVTASSLEVAEALLDEHIFRASTKSLWEQVLCGEQVLPYGTWERMEESLFTRIDKYQSIPVKKQPFWFIVEHYSSFLKTAAVAGAVTGIVLLALTGINSYKKPDVAIPTLVYQLEGRAVDKYPLSSAVDGRCAMVEGGYAKLVNSHGVIEVSDAAELTFDKITRNKARYHVGFSSGSDYHGSGAVSFLIHPHERKQSFSVSTDDYTIHVTGTYFRVEDDGDGKALTKVLEGSVVISSPKFGDTALYAGQYMQFDRLRQHYGIYSGGEVAGKEALDHMPDMEEILQYHVLAVRCDVPGADVFIDDTYAGATPVTVRESAGLHRISLRKNGFYQLDTAVELSDSGDDVNLMAFSLEKQPKEIVFGNAAVVEGEEERADNPEPVSNDQDTFASTYAYRKKKYRTSKRSYSFPSRPKKKPASSLADLYKEAQLAERSGYWFKALKLYEKVLDHPHATPLRREDALFSVGRLQAEHGSSIETAKQSFLTYLALFPHGTFAGESWLRLAELEFQRNPENAIQYYLKYFQMFPQHPRTAELQDRVGMIYLQKKRYEKAIAMFDHALSNNRSTGNIQLQRDIAMHLCRALEASGDLQRAEFIKNRYLASSTR
jgi:tetratricopeptide (TPR) repeat protein